MYGKIEIEVEHNLEEVYEIMVDIEDQVTEIRMEMELIAELQKEESVFECDIQGMKFKGTKSDFKVFIEGVTLMGKALQNTF